MRILSRVNHPIKFLFFLFLSTATMLSQASTINLFDVPKDSDRVQVMDIKSDGSFDFQVILPFKDKYATAAGAAKTKPTIPFLLHYNSLRANGLVGQGWNLEFFSYISRCDNSRRGLELSVNSADLDGLCLDGTPLKSFNLGWYRGYRGKLATGQRVSVVPVGDCSGAPCQFMVTSETGEVRYYGGPDMNSLNGDASIRNANQETLVWSLNGLVRGDTSFSFDYYQDPVTNNQVLEKALSVQQAAPLQVTSQQLFEFYYHDRWNNYSGEMDGLRLSLSNVLTSIEVHDLSVNQRAVRLRTVVNFDYSYLIQDKTLHKVESCQWGKGSRQCLTLEVKMFMPEGAFDRARYGDDYPFADPSENTLANYWYLVENSDCRRQWHPPYQHYFQCDDYLLNVIKVEELTLRLDLVNFETAKIVYDFTDDLVVANNPQSEVDKMFGKVRPWQIVSRLEKSIGALDITSNPLAVDFKWFRPDVSNRWTGFGHRQAMLNEDTGYELGVDLTYDTFWQTVDGLKVASSSNLIKGLRPAIDEIVPPDYDADNVTLSCQFESNYFGLMNISSRSQLYRQGNAQVCQIDETYAHGYFHTGPNAIVGSANQPAQCEFPDNLLPIGTHTYTSLVKGLNTVGALGTRNLPAQESCDLLADLLLPVGKYQPQGKQFPIFRPPGVPAPETPREDKGEVEEEGN